MMLLRTTRRLLGLLSLLSFFASLAAAHMSIWLVRLVFSGFNLLILLLTGIRACLRLMVSSLQRD